MRGSDDSDLQNMVDRMLGDSPQSDYCCVASSSNHFSRTVASDGGLTGAICVGSSPRAPLDLPRIPVDNETMVTGLPDAALCSCSRWILCG